MEQNKAVHYCVSLTWLGVSLWWWAAGLSFEPFDASPFVISTAPDPTHNFGGKLGSWIASHGITYYGLSYFLVPFFVLGFLLRKGKPFALIHNLALLVLSCFWASASLSDILISQIPFAAGGILGSTLDTLASQFLGNDGKWVLLPTLTALLIIPYLPKELLERNYLAKVKLKAPKFRRQKAENLPPVRELPAEIQVAQYQPAFEDLSTEENSTELTSDLEPTMTGQGELKEKYAAPSSHSVFTKVEGSREITPEQRRELETVASLLVKTFEEFGVQGRVANYLPGPVVTVFEFEMKAGIKQSKVIALCDDLALALKVDSILIQPVRGKRALGVQVPNRIRETVLMGEVIESSEFQGNKSPLCFAIGKSIAGTPTVTDLTSMPHLLVAGATGSGKSVGINSLICSVLMKAGPDQVRMILVDPKMLELSIYGKLPHLLMPVITDAEKASTALKWAVNEMERRYAIMQQAGIRNIGSFNEKWERLNDQQRLALKEETGIDNLDSLPYILVVIDELADLMLSAAKEVETNIQRLAQKARASGIHMVLATQRPSVDIITGVIKANLPSRIAFQVVSKHDSRTILDQMGAERLLGKGDMLFQKPGFQKLIRIQGAFMSDDEVERLVEEVSKNAPPNYDEEAMSWIDQNAGNQYASGAKGNSDFDAKWDEALDIAASQGFVSASYLQRQLKLGYNRAARIVEQMEKEGLVEQANGSKPRKWLGPERIM